MDALPAGIAAQMALTQKNVALSMIKQSANTEKQMANVLAEASQTLNASGRGSKINILA